MAPPSSVWNFPKQRDRFHHLLYPSDAERYPDAGSFLDDLNGSLSEPFEIISGCQDLFDGENFIQLDEHLKELNKIHSNWSELANELSLFHIEEKSLHRIDENSTNRINQRIHGLLHSTGVRLQGENGIGLAVNKLKNGMEVWVQKGKQAVDYKNILVKNKQLDLTNQPLQSPMSEDGVILEQVFRALEFDLEPLRAHIDTWFALSQSALKNVCFTKKYSIPTGLPKITSDYEQSGFGSADEVKDVQQIGAADLRTVTDGTLPNEGIKSSSLEEKNCEQEEWSSCQTHLLLWLTHMEKSIEATCARRLDEVKMVEEKILDLLVRIIPPSVTNQSKTKSINTTTNDPSKSNDEPSVGLCSVITDRLMRMSKSLWTKLAQDGIEGYKSEALSQQRASCFQVAKNVIQQCKCLISKGQKCSAICPANEKLIPYSLASVIEVCGQIFGPNSGVDQGHLTKQIMNLKVSKNLAQLVINRRGFRDKSTVLRYLQNADQTVRESSVMNPSDEGPFIIRSVAQGIDLPSNIPQTSMAYAGIHELELLRADQDDDETTASNAEKAALLEEEALYMELERTKSLREQIETKRTMLNNVKLLKNEAAIALVEDSAVFSKS
ncbi:hypothetical protein D915_007244 [Fasciola hepatica]|uniref:Uncharacterized protein n=1 Tax=Fasciola hepatica TaxID=6192 RepID=A0A4E0R4B0_FASHE|nr:hypothetical protein D915_007244 [Fasciola hepatica]